MTVEKRYRDANGEWQTSTSYFPEDLPKLQLVAAKAYEFCVMGEDEAGSASGAES